MYFIWHTCVTNWVVKSYQTASGNRLPNHAMLIGGYSLERVEILEQSLRHCTSVILF
jgi:hypothetical protein